MQKNKCLLLAALLLVGGVVGGALTGCSYALDSLHPTSTSSDSGNSSQSAPVTAEQIDYAMIKTQVIEPNCYQCHSASGGNKGGVNLETYQNLKAHLIDVQADLADDSMPDGGSPLSAEEKNLVNTWISNGAPETVSATLPVVAPAPAPSPAPTPTPTPAPIQNVTVYATVNSQIFQPYCVSCHSPAGDNRAGVNLEGYANVLKNISGVKSTINSGSMPRGTKLTAAQKKLILDWIAAGAPQSAAQAKAVSASSVQIMTKAYVDFMIQQSEQKAAETPSP